MKKIENDNKKIQENIIFKFKLWGIFFLIIFVLYGATSYISKNNNNIVNNNVNINYTKMKNNLINNSIKVNYVINDYLINGEVVNNIFKGTINVNNKSFNVEYDGKSLYVVEKSEKIINEELLKDVNRNYLLPKYIIEILNEPKNTAEKDDNIYSYNYKDVIYNVYINNKKIEKIIIKEKDNVYTLQYSL